MRTKKEQVRQDRKVNYLKSLKDLKEKKLISRYKYLKEVKWVREFNS